MYPVLRPHHLRDVNEIAVLRHLIATGPTPRLDIARAVGLTQAPITRIVARLVDRGLVRESADREQTGGRGRPRIPVELVEDASLVIGAHIGLQRLTLGVAHLDGRVVESVSHQHDGTWAGTLELIADYVRDVDRRTDRPVLGIGLIVGGIVDPTRGVLVRHDHLGWTDVPLRDDLRARVTHPVFVDASARAHASADLVFGTAGTVRDFVHAFVGNFVEVAVVVDGQVRGGRSGIAGDLSAWTVPAADGRASTAAAEISDVAVLERARAAGWVDDDAELPDLLAFAEGPSDAAEAARALLLDRARGVGRFLAGLDTLLGPELFVVSSGVLIVDGALEAVRSALASARRGLSVPDVRASRYGTNPIVSAAAALVLERTLLGVDQLAAATDVAVRSDDVVAERSDGAVAVRSDGAVAG